MKMRFHKGLTLDRWNQFSFNEQMANVGMEVYRTINWRERGDQNASDMAFQRALELFDFTFRSREGKQRIKELSSVRDKFIAFTQSKVADQEVANKLNDYFYAFNYAANLHK